MSKKKKQKRKARLLAEWEARQRDYKNAPRDFTPPYDPKPNC